MMLVAIGALAVLHGLVCLMLWKIDERLAKLEEYSHPPVDVRSVVKAYTRTEVERVLAEHVP